MCRVPHAAGPTYPGLRMPRPPDGEYFALLDEVVAAVVHKWPCAVLQFEDFSSPHCFQLLEKYRHAARIFNDDIQGSPPLMLILTLTSKILFHGGKENVQFEP